MGMTTPKKSRSGPSLGQADRMRTGRPITSFTLSLEVRELLAQLAKHYNLSKSAVVEMAVKELSKKIK